MATLLPLLLLLLGSAAGNHTFAKDLKNLCDFFYPTSDALHPSQCTQPPCSITKAARKLVLPFVLSLQERQGQHWPELWLHNTKGGSCGLVWLGLEGQDKVVLEGATCDRPEHKVTVTSSLASGGEEWVHVVVVMEGQQVRLYTPGNKDTPFTLNCQPSYATVVPHASGDAYGYSAINITTTQTSTTTTSQSSTITTTTSQPSSTTITQASTTTTTTTSEASIPICRSPHCVALCLGIASSIVVTVVIAWYITKTHCTRRVATPNTLQQAPHTPAGVANPATWSTAPLTRHDSDNSLYGAPYPALTRHDSDNSLHGAPYPALTRHGSDNSLYAAPYPLRHH